jgi:hypothetical protein
VRHAGHAATCFKVCPLRPVLQASSSSERLASPPRLQLTRSVALACKSSLNARLATGVGLSFFPSAHAQPQLAAHLPTACLAAYRRIDTLRINTLQTSLPSSPIPYPHHGFHRRRATAAAASDARAAPAFPAPAVPPSDPPGRAAPPEGARAAPAPARGSPPPSTPPNGRVATPPPDVPGVPRKPGCEALLMRAGTASRAPLAAPAGACRDACAAQAAPACGPPPPALVATERPAQAVAAAELELASWRVAHAKPPGSSPNAASCPATPLIPGAAAQSLVEARTPWHADVATEATGVSVSASGLTGAVQASWPVWSGASRGPAAARAGSRPHVPAETEAPRRAGLGAAAACSRPGSEAGSGSEGLACALPEALPPPSASPWPLPAAPDASSAAAGLTHGRSAAAAVAGLAAVAAVAASGRRAARQLGAAAGVAAGVPAQQCTPVCGGAADVASRTGLGDTLSGVTARAMSGSVASGGAPSGGSAWRAAFASAACGAWYGTACQPRPRLLLEQCPQNLCCQPRLQEPATAPSRGFRFRTSISEPSISEPTKRYPRYTRSRTESTHAVKLRRCASSKRRPAPATQGIMNGYRSGAGRAAVGAGAVRVQGCACCLAGLLLVRVKAHARQPHAARAQRGPRRHWRRRRWLLQRTGPG